MNRLVLVRLTHSSCSLSVLELLTAELKASQVYGGADPSLSVKQCRLRARLSGRLAQAGYCYGRKRQTDKEPGAARLSADLGL